jgi:DNA-binding transcriptional MerR regulator
MPKQEAGTEYLDAFEAWLDERRAKGDWSLYLRATGLNLSDIQEEIAIPRKHFYKGVLKARLDAVLTDLEARGLWARSTQPPTPRSPGCDNDTYGIDELEKRDREIRRLKTQLAEKAAELAALRRRRDRSIETLAPLGGRLFPSEGQ